MTDKGRISVPSKFRDLIRSKYSEEILIITNFNKCLAAYPLKEWNAIENKVAELPQFKQEVISFLRYLMGGAVECSIDSQGRILVPQSLRNYAQLDKEVVLIGMLNRFEVWSKEIWENEESLKSYEEFQKSSEKLAGQGI